MGTIKLLILPVLLPLSGELDLSISSGGISSAAGIGRPLPAAINWCSVHSSLKSSNPLQNGAIRRSICYRQYRLQVTKLTTNHQLSHDGLAEILSTGIDSHGN